MQYGNEMTIDKHYDWLEYYMRPIETGKQ